MRFKLQRLIDFGGRYIYRDDYHNTEYDRNCSEHIDTTMKNYVTKMGTIFLSYIFALIGPTSAYFLHGIKTTTSEMRMPFCEPKSNAEFLLNFFLQTAIALHGITFYIGLEVVLSLFENIVTIAPRLVKSELENTIQMYEDKSISESELRWRVGRIVKFSQDTDK